MHYYDRAQRNTGEASRTVGTATPRRRVGTENRDVPRHRRNGRVLRYRYSSTVHPRRCAQHRTRAIANAPLSENPSLEPDELEHVHAPDPQRIAHVGNLRPLRIACGCLLGHDGTTLKTSQSDHEWVGPQPRSGWIHEPSVIAKDLLYGNLDGIIGHDKHRSALACPRMHFVVHLLQFDQNFLARDQLSLFDEFIDFLPQCREDLLRIRASPGVQDGTRINAIAQAAAPALTD